jgi:tRNA G37 N-methylase Trm5
MNRWITGGCFMLKKVIPFSHYLLEQSIVNGEIVVDATAGNGHDTLFLANLVGSSGHVFSFDIQDAALQNTKALLEKHKKSNVTCILDSHSEMTKYIDQPIGGAIFNLGYLPGSDHSITTKAETTIKAIESLLSLLKIHKLIVLVVYHGHAGGKEEKDELLAFLQSLDQKKYQVLQYSFINQKNHPPFVLAIEKIAH